VRSNSTLRNIKANGFGRQADVAFLHSLAAKLSQGDFIVVANESFGILGIESLLIQPDSDSPSVGLANDLFRVNIVTSELAVLVEDISGYQSFDLVESYYHAVPFIGFLRVKQVE